MSIIDRVREGNPSEADQREIDRACEAFTKEGSAIFGREPEVSPRQFDQLVEVWGPDIRRCVAARGEGLSLFDKSLVLLKQELIQMLAICLRLPTETLAAIYSPEDRAEFSRMWDRYVRSITDSHPHPSRHKVAIAVAPEVFEHVAKNGLVVPDDSWTPSGVAYVLDYDRWCKVIDDLLYRMIGRMELPGGPVVRVRPGAKTNMFPAHGKVFDPARAMWWAYLEPVEDGNELVVLDYHEMD